MRTILYISYDGMLEPLGESQVIEYLLKLSKDNSICLLSYEKSNDWRDKKRRKALKENIARAGIRWFPLTYHRHPSVLATAFDVFAGFWLSLFICLFYDVKIVHARSYVAAIPAYLLKRFLGKKFLFDMRGFWADERVDAGIWSKGSRLYAAAKWFERKFLIFADAVVSLTDSGVEIMQGFGYLQSTANKFYVIPTCVNTDKFNLKSKGSNGTSSVFTLGYAGSLKGWYIFDPVLAVFNALCKVYPDSRLVVLTRDEKSYVEERLEANGVDQEKVEINCVPFDDIPVKMNKMSAGIFFIKDVFSKKGSMPTKLGEFLACGVPCICNDYVTDVSRIILEEHVGIVISDFSQEAYEQAVIKLRDLCLDPGIRQRCNQVANKYFSLDKGVLLYGQIYDHLVKADN